MTQLFSDDTLGQVLWSEGIGQEVIHPIRRPQSVGATGENTGRRGRELSDLLAATPTAGGERLRVADGQQHVDLALPSRGHRSDRARLSTPPLRVRGVLDVGADIQGARGTDEGATDRIPRVRHVGVGLNGSSGLEESAGALIHGFDRNGLAVHRSI